MWKKLWHKIKNWRLIYKVLAVNLLTLFVPLFTVGVVYCNQLCQNQLKQLEHEQKYILELSEKSVSGNVAEIELIAKIIGQSVYMDNFLGGSFEKNAEGFSNYWLFLNYLQSIAGSSNAINSLTIFYNNDSIPEHWGNMYRLDRLDRTIIAELFEDDNGGKWYFGKNFNLLGLDLQQLPKQFIEEEEFVYLLPLYSQAQETFYGYLKIGAAKSKLFSALSRDKKFRVQHKNGDILLDFVSKGKENYEKTIEFSTDLRALNSKMYLLADVSSLLKPEEYLTVVAIFILIFLVSSLFSLFIIRYLMKRFERVSHFMQKVSGGEFVLLEEDGRHDEAGDIVRVYNQMVHNIIGLQESIIQKERERKNAEINALRLQINPHFLYNILDVFCNRLEEVNQFELSNSLVILSRMLRYSTNWNGHSTVFEELNHLKNYIALQHLAYGEEVQMTVQCPAELMEVKLPKMCLQPIVENAIIHGKRKGKTISIKLNVRTEPNRFVLEINDDGCGIPQEQLKLLNDALINGVTSEQIDGRIHIGLHNINKRLKLEYNEEYGIIVESKENFYTRVLLTIPRWDGGEEI
ncbi:MAG: histidine kinase [Clostridiales bacterium]|nr:histidine kinase [Clostridiales bacterium]